MATPSKEVIDYFAVVSEARAGLDQAPVIIGHSMGGLLGQKLAAETETAALVLLASIPPGALSAQIRSMPHLFALLPGILAGRAIRPSDRTMRAVPLSSLPTVEQDDILPRLVPDAGRVFRSMMLVRHGGNGWSLAAAGPVVPGDAEQ